MLPAAALHGMTRALEVIQQVIASGEPADRKDLLVDIEAIMRLMDYASASWPRPPVRLRRPAHISLQARRWSGAAAQVRAWHYRRATVLSTSPRILLQKSFCTGDQKFSGP
jgi:hypothetical protein